MILIVNNGSIFIEIIEGILKEDGQDCVVVPQDALFQEIEEHQYIGVVLSGGPKPNLDEAFRFDMIKANIACLINYDLPVLGICEGHEIFGDACGGVVAKMPEPSIHDELPITVTDRTGIFAGLPETFPAYEHHSYAVQSVPPILEIAAHSSVNKIEALFHRTRPLFSTQFHPEKSGEFGKTIFRNFVKICRQHRPATW